MNTFISKHLQFIFTSLIQCIFMYFGRLLAKMVEGFLFSLMSTRHNSMVFWKTFQIMEEPFSLDQLACVRTCPPLATQLIILLCFSSTHLDNILSLYFLLYSPPILYIIYHIYHIFPSTHLSTSRALGLDKAATCSTLSSTGDSGLTLAR